MSQYFGIDDECNVVNLLCCRLVLYIRYLGVGKLEAASLAINPLHKECRLCLTSYDAASSPFLLLVAAEKEMLSSSYLSTQVLDELPIWKFYSEIAADFAQLRELVEDLCNSRSYGSDALTRLPTLSSSPMCQKKNAKRMPSSSNLSSSYHPPKVGEPIYCGKMRHSILQHELLCRRAVTYDGEWKRVDRKPKMVVESSKFSYSRSSDDITTITTPVWCMLDCVQQLVSYTQIRLCMASAYRDIVICKPWTKCGGYTTAISVMTELRNVASELLQCKQVKPLQELIRTELLTTERALVLCDAFSKHDMFNTSMSLVQLRSSITEYRNYLGLDMEEEDQPIPRMLLWANAVASGVERRFPLFFPWASIERLDDVGLIEHFETFVNDCVLTFEAFDFEEGSSNTYAMAALVLDFVVSLDSTIDLCDRRRRTPSVNGSYVFPFASDDRGAVLSEMPSSNNNFMDQAVNNKFHKLRNERCRDLISSQWHIIDNPVTTDNETPSVYCGGVSSTGTETTAAAADGGGFDTRKIIFMRYASKRDESIDALRPDHIDPTAHSAASRVSLSNDITTNLHGSGGIASTTATEIPDTTLQNAEKGFKGGDQHHNVVQGGGELPINSTTYPTSVCCTQDLWPLIKSAMLDGSENTFKKSELMDFGLPVALELADSPFQTTAYVARVTQRLDLVLAVRSDKRHTYETEVMKFANCVLHQLRDEASFEELLPKW